MPHRPEILTSRSERSYKVRQNAPATYVLRPFKQEGLTSEASGWVQATMPRVPITGERLEVKSMKSLCMTGRVVATDIIHALCMKSTHDLLSKMQP